MRQPTLVKNALEAMRIAVKKVTQEHQEKDLPMVFWKNGKIVWEKPWTKKPGTGAISGLNRRS